MQKLSLVCFTITLSLTTAPILGKKPSHDKETAIILGNCADMAASFFKLLEKPKDPEHVGRNLGDMVAKFVEIIAREVKKGKKLEEHAQSPEFREEVAKLFVKRMRCTEKTDHVDIDF